MVKQRKTLIKLKTINDYRRLIVLLVVFQFISFNAVGASDTLYEYKYRVLNYSESGTALRSKDSVFVFKTFVLFTRPKSDSVRFKSQTVIDTFIYNGSLYQVKEKKQYKVFSVLDFKDSSRRSMYLIPVYYVDEMNPFNMAKELRVLIPVSSRGDTGTFLFDVYMANYQRKGGHHPFIGTDRVDFCGRVAFDPVLMFENWVCRDKTAKQTIVNYGKNYYINRRQLMAQIGIH